MIIVALPLCTNFSFAETKKSKEGFTYNVKGKVRLRHDEFSDLYSNNGYKQTESYLRRADLEIAGSFSKKWDYEIEASLNREDDTKLKTAMLEWNLPKRFRLAAGRFDPDFGLERSGSSTWITGIERSSIWELSPHVGDGDESNGVTLRHHGDHHFISLGGFDVDTGNQTNLRLVALPLSTDTQFLHLGYSINQVNNANTEGKISTDLSVWSIGFSDNGNSTRMARPSRIGLFNQDQTALFELAYQYGSFSFQSEWIDRKLESDSAESREATGHYAQIAYSLTGEQRDYSIKKGKFGSINPNHNWGALEVFYRRDDLNTKGLELLSQGRTTANATLDVIGFNWYLQKRLKVSINYLRAKTDTLDNDVGDLEGDAFSGQLQIVF